MSVTHQYTQDDYIVAGRLHIKVPLRRNYLFWILLIGACLSAIIWSKFWYFPLILIAVEIFANALQNYVAVPFSIKRQLKQNPALFSSDVTITQNEEGLSFESQRGHINVMWTDIFRWKHDKRYLLLYLTSRVYYIVPKRLQAQGIDIANLLDKLNNTVGKPS